MKAIETPERPRWADAPAGESIIRFEEGLIGFAEFKHFTLLENADLAPFRLLRAVDFAEVGFLVLEPALLVPGYCGLVPDREWEAIGVTRPEDRLAFVTVILNDAPEESTGNLQAPLLINYRDMIGRQVILTESDFSVRQPLIAPPDTRA